MSDLRSDIVPVKQTTFQFVDARPESDRPTRVERVGPNLYRYLVGDDRIKPSLPMMLETYLYQSMGDKLKDKKVEISKADVRIYQKTLFGGSGVDYVTYIPPQSMSPGAVIGGLFLADFLEIGFTDKRIEIEFKGVCDGKEVRATEYGTYSIGSPEKEAYQLINKAMQNFAGDLR